MWYIFKFLHFINHKLELSIFIFEYTKLNVLNVLQVLGWDYFM